MSANPSLGAVLFTDLLATPQQVGAIEQRILRGMEVVNTNTAVAYVQCYDSASSPTLGSPKIVFRCAWRIIIYVGECVVVFGYRSAVRKRFVAGCDYDCEWKYGAECRSRRQYRL
jgi:hypothetical protein